MKPNLDLTPTTSTESAASDMEAPIAMVKINAKRIGNTEIQQSENTQNILWTWNNMTREQSEYDFEFESFDKSFFELSATIKSGKGLFEFYIWIFVLLAIALISWVFSLNYWYQYVYYSTSDTFYYSKSAASIFIVPLVIAIVLTLLYFYDERRFNIHKMSKSTSIFRPYVWKISHFQRYMKCVILIALVPTMYCIIWSLITVGSIYSTNVPSPLKKDSIDYSCW